MEYETLGRVFSWNGQEFLRTNLMGLEAAFVDNSVKRQLRNHLLEAYGESAPSPALS
jgi:hypothetical protein